MDKMDADLLKMCNLKKSSYLFLFNLVSVAFAVFDVAPDLNFDKLVDYIPLLSELSLWLVVNHKSLYVLNTS